MEKPKTEKINLTDIISETIRSLKIPESVRVILNLPDEPLFVDIEAEQIRIALKNVIRNAVQAMNESGMLTIITQPKEEGFVEMTLTENGP